MQMNETKKTFLVGFSGGADSTAVLLLLHERMEMGNRLVAVHFNHHLRGSESDLEAENARLMYGLMQESALFGYEAANHYYFNQGMLMEKVVSCAYLRDQLLARTERGTET